MKSPISLLSVGKAASGIKSLADAGAAAQLAFEGMLGAISPLTLAIAGIGAAFLVWKAYNNYIQEQVQAAQEAGNAWQESNHSIEEYKNRVVELRDQLASGSLTESEAYQAKSELLSIQEMLTEAYGSQAEGIDLVNGSLREQIGLMEHLSQSDANKYLNENQEGINKATKEMEKQRNYFLGEYFEEAVDPASEAIKKALAASQEKYGDLITSSNDMIFFNGDASQAEAALNDFMTDVRKASDELGGDYAYVLDAIFSNSESGLKDANEILDKYQEVYEQAKAAELAADSTQYKGTNGVVQTAAKWMSDYSKAVQEYNDALAGGDSSKIAEAKTNFDAVDKSVQCRRYEPGKRNYGFKHEGKEYTVYFDNRGFNLESQDKQHKEYLRDYELMELLEAMLEAGYFGVVETLKNTIKKTVKKVSESDTKKAERQIQEAVEKSQAAVVEEVDIAEATGILTADLFQLREYINEDDFYAL